MTEPDREAAAQAARVRNAHLFDLLADSYDGVGVAFFGPIGEGLVSALELRAGERVADLGCGKGAFLLPAARTVGGTGRAVGLDVSPAMVDLARTSAESEGLAHVEVHVDDAQAPTLEQGAFDSVGASLVLFFLPDPVGALRAWAELVRPGGRIGVSTFGTQDPIWRAVDDVFTPYLPQAMLDARTSGARGPFASDAGVAGLFGSAGLADVRTTTLDLAVRFRDAGQWHAFLMSTGQRAMWLAVPESERPNVRAEAERRLAEAADPDTGEFVLHQQIRFTVGRRPPG